MSWHNHPKTVKRPARTKSSIAARRLIKAAIQKHGSERAAAYALRLESQAALNKLKRGLIKDTPAMRAAIARAEKRAERAYYLEPGDPSEIDRACLLEAIDRIEKDLQTARECLKNKSASSVP